MKPSTKQAVAYREFSAAIVANEAIGAQYFRLVLDCPGMASCACPGQFVMLGVNREALPLLRRPLSIHDVQKGRVILLVRIAGRGTAMLSRALPGQNLDLLGPLGRGFKLPDSARRPLVIGGGIGVAPLVFLARHLADKGLGIQTRVVIGGRSGEHVLCADLFRSLGMNVSIFTDDGSAGRRGVVTDGLSQWLDTDGPDIIYACGPEPMLKVVAAMARQAAIACQLSLESRMACGMGVCLGCALRTPTGSTLHVCVDGPVMEASLLWS